MKTRIIAVAALLLLTLTGCAGAPESAASEPEQASESAAPLVAEAPAEPEGDEAEQLYVEALRGALRPNNVIPDATDEQLIAAGLDACEKLSSGVTGDDLTVIEGEERNSGGYYEDSGVIATQARLFLCPA